MAKKDKKSNLGTLAKGVAAGIVIGATATALSNKDTRDKLKEKAKDLKAKADKNLQKTQSILDEKKKETTKKIAKKLKKTGKKLES